MEPVTPSWLLLGARATYRVTISAALINGIRASSSNFALPPQKNSTPYLHEAKHWSTASQIWSWRASKWENFRMTSSSSLFLLSPLPFFLPFLSLPFLLSLLSCLLSFTPQSPPPPLSLCSSDVNYVTRSFLSNIFNAFSGFSTTPICL